MCECDSPVTWHVMGTQQVSFPRATSVGFLILNDKFQLLARTAHELIGSMRHIIYCVPVLKITMTQH